MPGSPETAHHRKETTVSDRVYIRDLKAAQNIDGVFAVQNCQLGKTKNGKPFIKCLLADKTGRTPGRMWNTSEEQFQTLPTDGFVWIAGQTQPYQGEMQIIIQDIRPYEPSAADLTELLPSTEYDIDQMFAEVLAFLQSLEHPAIKELANRYLEDGDLMDKFCKAPAAMTLHHAYLGGLLEHTLGLMKLANAFCPLYPKLNRDIILFGLFLHDMGKCDELTWENGFGYSDDGQLVGHIARGAIWLEQKAQACEQAGTKVPSAILKVLTHIILSHHGVPEYGALKIPATPEAIAISLLDNLDAKLNMALTAARSDDGKPADLGGDFTEKIWALDTRLYRPDPTTVPDSE
jgi:3'-5' exoribonuclease